MTDTNQIEDTLRKYIRKTCSSTLERCGQVLDNKGAVEHFGKAWQEYKDSLLMMTTSIEYEFISKEDFTKDDLATLRHAIGNILLFFKGCADEVEEMKIQESKNLEK